MIFKLDTIITNTTWYDWENTDIAIATRRNNRYCQLQCQNPTWYKYKWQDFKPCFRN